MNKKLDDLIRIEDAIKVLCRKICHPGVVCPDGYCVEMWDEFNDIERVDAVPVVRCRDCEYWDTIPRSTVAPLHHQCKETRLMTTGIWYCPLGKRKDGDGNG